MARSLRGETESPARSRFRRLDDNRKLRQATPRWKRRRQRTIFLRRPAAGSISSTTPPPLCPGFGAPPGPSSIFQGAGRRGSPGLDGGLLPGPQTGGPGLQDGTPQTGRAQPEAGPGGRTSWESGRAHHHPAEPAGLAGAVEALVAGGQIPPVVGAGACGARKREHALGDLLDGAGAPGPDAVRGWEVPRLGPAGRSAAPARAAAAGVPGQALTGEQPGCRREFASATGAGVAQLFTGRCVSPRSLETGRTRAASETSGILCRGCPAALPAGLWFSAAGWTFFADAVGRYIERRQDLRR